MDELLGLTRLSAQYFCWTKPEPAGVINTSPYTLQEKIMMSIKRPMFQIPQRWQHLAGADELEPQKLPTEAHSLLL